MNVWRMLLGVVGDWLVARRWAPERRRAVKVVAALPRGVDVLAGLKVGDDNATYLAVMTVAAAQEQEAAEVVTRRGMPAEERAYWAGALWMAGEIQDELERIRQAAVKDEAKTEVPVLQERAPGRSGVRFPWQRRAN